MKARSFKEVSKFQDIPNIGKRMEEDLRALGIKKPADLRGKDPYVLYKKRCKQTGTRQDPCVLDVYMATIDFANGAPARPWFFYTKERKKHYPNL